MARTGRPKKNIDKKQFEKLCQLQCTIDEVCGFFEVCPDTLEAWCRRTYGRGMTFSKVFKEKRSGGMISLRKAQFKLAEKNASMAIWMGKQYLGQTDKLEMRGDFKVDPETITAVEDFINGKIDTTAGSINQ